DRELAHACLRSYNDWILEDFQAAHPDRLVALPMLPVDDGCGAAIAELERVLAKSARGAFIPGMPGRPYHDPSYDPLWAAAAARRTAHAPAGRRRGDRQRGPTRGADGGSRRGGRRGGGLAGPPPLWRTVGGGWRGPPALAESCERRGPPTAAGNAPENPHPMD